MCAIVMAKLPFFINLKFSRAVECKNILKLPRPTLHNIFGSEVISMRPVEHATHFNI